MDDAVSPQGPLSRKALKALRLKPAPGQQPAKRVWSRRRGEHIELFDVANCAAMRERREPTQAQLAALAAGRRKMTHADCGRCGCNVVRPALDRDGNCLDCAELVAGEEQAKRDMERFAEFDALLTGSAQAVYLDTETTGLDPFGGDELLEIALISHDGTVLLDTLLRPVVRTSWLEAQAIHGITPEMVATAPTLAETLQQISRILGAAESLVIYNAEFDLRFLPCEMRQMAKEKARCAMRAFSLWYGERSERYGDFRRHKLEVAAAVAGHNWTGDAHRALADAQAVRHVWHWLQRSKAERGAVDGVVANG